ncbi:Acyl carrier protein [Paramicrosporidium saccamoebae]|uniref:Acyl carrier protein n=1 Tax=Paramicrosporidium saccamoebae TaxID=1246581 RepID=A0A2H9TLW2_9FUNG|nr:Acyl carrier protein [Paramicrosporidium saccamoebae]
MHRSVAIIRRLIRSPVSFARRFHAASIETHRSVAIKPTRLAMPFQTVRFSSTHSSPAETESRVLSVLKTFDKVDAAKLSSDTPFSQLGLDSLDVVEVMIALEEEFHMEIPDAVADKVQTPKEIAEYIHSFLNPHRPAEEDSISEGGHH